LIIRRARSGLAECVTRRRLREVSGEIGVAITSYA
jgi:hypothetical protein